VNVTGLSSGATAVSVGSEAGCALTAAGGVRCWGSNLCGEVGDGSNAEFRKSPVTVTGLSSGVQAISVGHRYACALTTGGGVKCWGYPLTGLQGPYCYTPGVRQSLGVPRDVPGLSAGVTAISAGMSHTCALMANGTVRCWGLADWGLTGDGTYDNSIDVPADRNRLNPDGVPYNMWWTPDPTEVVRNDNGAPLTGIVNLSAGSQHSCAVTNTGEVWCWGSNFWGELGIGNAGWFLGDHTPGAVRVVDAHGSTAPFTGVAEVATGEAHSCALTFGGGVKCWGYVGTPYAGNPAEDVLAVDAPVDITELQSGVIGLEAGGVFPCVVLSDGGVRCWGLNSYGQVGDGTTVLRDTPTGVIGTP